MDKIKLFEEFINEVFIMKISPIKDFFAENIESILTIKNLNELINYINSNLDIANFKVKFQEAPSNMKPFLKINELIDNGIINVTNQSSSTGYKSTVTFYVNDLFFNRLKDHHIEIAELLNIFFDHEASHQFNELLADEKDKLKMVFDEKISQLKQTFGMFKFWDKYAKIKPYYSKGHEIDPQAGTAVSFFIKLQKLSYDEILDILNNPYENMDKINSNSITKYYFEMFGKNKKVISDFLDYCKQYLDKYFDK